MKNEDFVYSIYTPAYTYLLKLGKKKEQAHVWASLLASQAVHESAWGAKTSGTNNFFGIKATGNQRGTTVTTHEGYGTSRKLIKDKFVDYNSIDDGVRAAIDMLNTKFHVFDGEATPESYVDSLHKYNYFTDSRDNYLRSLKGILDGPTMKRALSNYQPQNIQIDSENLRYQPIIHPTDATRVARPSNLLPYRLGGKIFTKEMVERARKIARDSRR